LKDLSGSRFQAFYDGRYLEGYMEDWPESKLRRVSALLGSMPLADEGRALDFGCGQGVFTSLLRDNLPGWQICGCELSDVALQMASKRLPDCDFVKIDELRETGSFDFVFSHHVLEHVLDIDETLDQITELTRTGSQMLHILPCGNAGSFEHRLASWHVDGIQSEASNRFFFEDEGHLRRLTSADLIRSAKRRGWTLSSQHYSNHFWGALEWITSLDVGFISEMTTLKHARNSAVGARLLGWRLILSMMSLARRAPGSPVGAFLSREAHSEWDHRQHDEAGSEMYLVFRRA